AGSPAPTRARTAGRSAVARSFDRHHANVERQRLAGERMVEIEHDHVVLDLVHADRAVVALRAQLRADPAGFGRNLLDRHLSERIRANLSVSVAGFERDLLAVVDLEPFERALEG